MRATLRFIFVLFITYKILKRAYRRKSLSYSGCIAAILVGIVVSFSNFCHLLSLMAFFYFSNKATNYKQELKKKFDLEFKECGERDAFQVLSNGFFATFYSFFYIIDCGFGERPIDFLNDYKTSWHTLAVLASLASCCGDTFSSELGTVLGNKHKNTVFHIIKFKQVPKGTNGGVTYMGTLASIFGGFLVGLAYYLCLKFCLYIQELYYYEDFEHIPPQWPILIIGAFSGLLGSFVDSLLGGYFQYSGLDLATNKVSNIPGKNIKHISGYDLFSNNQVNWFSCLISSILTPYFSFNLYKFI